MHLFKVITIGALSVANSVSSQPQTELPIGANNCAIAQALNVKLPVECLDPPLGQKRGIVIRLDSEIRSPAVTKDIAVAVSKPIQSKPATPPIKTIPISYQAAKSENGYYIHFALNSFELEPDYKEHLERVATVLTSNSLSNSCLRVTGHTDTTGDADYNLNLSEKRAVMVATYLAEVGKIDPKRIQIMAAGEKTPLPDIAGNDPRNRRVEFLTKDSKTGCT